MAKNNVDLLKEKKRVVSLKSSSSRCADAHSRRNCGGGTEDHAQRGENKVEALVNPVGIRRGLEVLAIFLRLVHQPRFAKRLQITPSLFRH